MTYSLLEQPQTNFEQIIALPNISWQTYQNLKQDMGDRSGIRLSYSQGLLGIKMPSKIHEIINRLLARIVSTLTEELSLEIVDMGSVTLDREDLARGVELDTCFYIQNAHQLQGLDPQIPPNLPPDLAIEDDITSPSTHRREIYQQLGISEVWCYAPSVGLQIFHLQDRSYKMSQTSLAFPILTSAKVNQVLTDRSLRSENSVIYDLRQWVKAESCNAQCKF
jgi:Uma2 family endonuclease